MTETFVCLFAAWQIADLAGSGLRLRAGWRDLTAAILVLMLSTLFLGSLNAWMLALLAFGQLVRAGLLHLSPAQDGVGGFLLDKAPPLFAILAVSLSVPDVFENGIWVEGPGAALFDRHPSGPQISLSALAILGGALFCVRAGGEIVAGLFASLGFQDPDGATGLPGGGQAIGWLERGLVFFLVLTGQMATIGFLIAAKSFLRFGAVQERRASEYVIIGTLASFGWALVVAWATAFVLGGLT